MVEGADVTAVEVVLDDVASAPGVVVVVTGVLDVVVCVVVTVVLVVVSVDVAESGTHAEPFKTKP